MDERSSVFPVFHDELHDFCRVFWGNGVPHHGLVHFVNGIVQLNVDQGRFDITASVHVLFVKRLKGCGIHQRQQVFKKFIVVQYSGRRRLWNDCLV